MDEDQPQSITIRKVAATQLVSNELLREPEPPTREQRIAAHERAVAAWETYDEAREALSRIADPAARAVLDLHWPEDVEHPRCPGCDLDGYEVEAPEWPCRTVAAIAEVYKIPLPDGYDLWRRPSGDFDPDVIPTPVSFDDLMRKSLEALSFGFKPDPDA